MINLEDFEDFEPQTDSRRPRRLKSNHKPKLSPWEVVASLEERDAAGRSGLTFAPSLNASEEEKAWMIEHLSQFYHGHLIADVARRVKGGKEANVYCCLGHPASGFDLVAAKLYRPRKFRSLKNTTQYQQGRAVLDAAGGVVGQRDWRMLKAIAQKSRTGMVAAQTSWLMYEFTLMQKLHAAGADVPAPIKHNEYALLMEYIGEEGMPAPALIDVELNAAEARPLFDRLLWNIELMLAQGWVHGDLSAYNVLYWQGEITLIDFPQVVDPQGNPDARFIFRRDVERVCQYFERYGIREDGRRLAYDLWQKCAPRHEALP
jgi:RIO kinase 1